jgi:dTDP-glucose pyrophosphorylase
MLNIVIPMAWAWSRFANAWYTFPKPLVEIKWKPMIQVVVDNLKSKNRTDYKFTFIVQKEHYEKYALKYLLNLIAPNCNIVIIDYLTKWAACTVLLASEFIDNDDELLLANSDQFIANWIEDYLDFSSKNDLDWTIMSFKATHPKWSFARLDENWNVEEVAEKKPISDIATVWVYYFKKWKYFVEWAKNMIKKNITTNGEFYVAPVYNELILQNKIIKIFDIWDRMYGIWTPEDLNRFLETDLAENL